MHAPSPDTGSQPAAGSTAPASPAVHREELVDTVVGPAPVDRPGRPGGRRRPARPASGTTEGSRSWLGAGPSRRGWLIGAGFSGGAWLLGAVGRFLPEGTPTAVLQLVHAVLFLLAYAAVPVISARVASRWQWPLAAVVILLYLPFPWVLPEAAGWLLVYVVGAIVAQRHSPRVGIAVTIAGAVAAFALQARVGEAPTDLIGAPILVLAIGFVFVSMQRQFDAQCRLRAAQADLATAALEGERLRVARDVHDILGHSLTVITVKAQLAGRLMELDPARAAAEIAELEALSRSALADVRATVTGFRRVTIVSELAAAASALQAAGVTAELPTAADDVVEPARELFGWVLREAVTNVVRHSRAHRCRVVLGPRRIRIDDDGVGPRRDAGHEGAGDRNDAAWAAHGGNGLRGLTERVDAAGAVLTVGRSPLGGYLVEVSV